MTTLVGDWVIENCTTSGTGVLILAGPADASVASFADAMVAGSVWYAIKDGDNRESGIGTFDGGNQIQRTLVHSTLVGGVFDNSSPAPISLSGTSSVASSFTATAFLGLLDLSLDDLIDVILSAPINGQVLAFNGTNWVNVTPADMVLAAIQTVTGRKTFNDGQFALRNVLGTFNALFLNNNTTDRVYTLKDGSGTLAFVSDITDANLIMSDITTNNFSTSQHGFVPKGENAGKYLKDNGVWDTLPPSGVSADTPNWAVPGTDGKVLVPPVNIDALTDVQSPAPLNDQVLTYDFAAAKWMPKTSTASLGMMSFNYRLSLPTTATPSSGRVSRNNTPALTTILYMHKLDSAGTDQSLFIQEMTEGDWLNLHSNSNTANFEQYDVTAPPVKVGDVWQIPVVFFSIGGTALLNNDLLNIVWRIQAAPVQGTVPPGGVVGQVLTKLSSADYDDSWQTPSGGGGNAPFVDGTVGAPAVTWANELTTGRYRAGLNDVRESVAGVDRVRYTAHATLPMDIWQVATASWGQVAYIGMDNNYSHGGPTLSTRRFTTRNTLGGIQMEMDTSGAAAIRQTTPTSTPEKSWITLARDAEVGLRYNDVQKMMTTADGITVTGAIATAAGGQIINSASSTVLEVVALTQAAYNALVTKVPTTLYVING